MEPEATILVRAVTEMLSAKCGGRKVRSFDPKYRHSSADDSLTFTVTLEDGAEGKVEEVRVELAEMSNLRSDVRKRLPPAVELRVRVADTDRARGRRAAVFRTLKIHVTPDMDGRSSAEAVQAELKALGMLVMVSHPRLTGEDHVGYHVRVEDPADPDFVEFDLVATAPTSERATEMLLAAVTAL